MDKKEIASGLLKIANTLDNMGLIVEANNLDKIAKKIVVSKNPEVNLLSLGQALSIPVTGNYKEDIVNYKKLLSSYYSHERNNTLNNDDLQKFKTLVNKFISTVKQKYEGDQYSAFYNQAKRIQYDLENNLSDINENIGANQESLNEFLRLYHIADEYGDLADEIKSRAEFNKRWNSFMNDFRVKQIVDRAGDKITKSLGYTYKILSAKLPYDSD
jgi:hypothetical protein